MFFIRGFNLSNLIARDHLRSSIAFISNIEKNSENVDNFINTNSVQFVGKVRNDATDKNFQRKDFQFSDNLFETLHDTFGIKKFRPNQLETVNAAMLNNDCFVLMPTGGGKSLCYQLPAILCPGVTIVVSPLISLIHDQVSKLKDLGIPSDHLSADSNVHSVLDDLEYSPKPDLKLLYVTPEKIKSNHSINAVFSSLYRRGLLSRFVIDEAHCVSVWGHDFRPYYCHLKQLRKNYPGVSFMALTATATPRVRKDIVKQLCISKTKWFITSFFRSNLQYEVHEKKGKKYVKDIIDLIKRNKFSHASYGASFERDPHAPLYTSVTLYEFFYI